MVLVSASQEAGGGKCREVEAEDVSDTDFEEEFADQLVEKPKKTIKVEKNVDEEDEKILEEVIKKSESKNNKKDTKKKIRSNACLFFLLLFLYIIQHNF